MKKSLIGIAVFLGVAFTACNNTNENKTNSQSTETDKILIQKSKNMKNIISIVEIPTTDFARAVKFYQTILGVSIEEVDMNGTQMGVLPSDGETVNVVLVKGNDYKPTNDGAVLYLNAGNDLQPMLDKVDQNGGQVIVPKTEISPEMGFFALFIDTEGNKLGLHSSN
jgi:predicted enzyme related to lactoylglutathione lyase